MVGTNVFSFFCLFTALSGGEFYFIYGDLILSCPAQFTKKAPESRHDHSVHRRFLRIVNIGAHPERAARDPCHIRMRRRARRRRCVEILLCQVFV
jgi:hypothetical protein